MGSNPRRIVREKTQIYDFEQKAMHKAMRACSDKSADAVTEAFMIKSLVMVQENEIRQRECVSVQAFWYLEPERLVRMRRGRHHSTPRNGGNTMMSIAE